MALQKYEIDMSTGSLPKKLIRFTLPLMTSNLLQLLYNAADVIVVGNFAGSAALAGVGATGSLINLITNLFIGLSTGTSVLVSHCYGARDAKGVGDAVHTSMLLSLIGGIVCCAIGLGFARPILTLMATPDDVIDGAVLYMQIYFLGMPASMVYNFGSAILRAVGDTKRPLYILTASGIVNVVLNLFLVITFHLGIAGVAIATVVSQYLSAAALIVCLVRSQSEYRLDVRKLRIHRPQFVSICRVGLPAGLNGCTFSLANVVIQSSINSFGSAVVAGSTAAVNLESFVYTAMDSVSYAALTATAQNVGAKQKKRIYQSLKTSLGLVVLIGGALCALLLVFRRPLLRVYSSDPAVIDAGAQRMFIICLCYWLCGVMNVLAGHLRGMGCSILPTLVTLFGACGFRIVWVYTVFAAYRNIVVLYLALGTSWVLSSLGQFVSICIMRPRILRRIFAEPEPTPKG